MVKNRKAQVLIPVIRRVCLPDTKIYSDMWRLYHQLSSIECFSRGTVNHKLHIIDPSSGIQTQNIERYWNKIRLNIKGLKGCKGLSMPKFLNKMMQKHN